jgi:hypothetical protein
MQKYCLITTYYGKDALCPSKENTKLKFNYDADNNDLYINFSDTFDPWNKEHLDVGCSGRKDLIYGKIFLLKNFIVNNIQNKYEFLCHIDYSDVKFTKSFKEMMLKFENSNLDFCIATEKSCWPYLEIVQQWTNNKLSETEFYYINSGCIISKTEIFINYLDKLINLCLNTNIDFWDDQGAWQYYNSVIEPLHSDRICEYFFCTALLDNTYYSVDNNQIKTKFNTYPYIIHDNSSFSLNLINNIPEK